MNFMNVRGYLGNVQANGGLGPKKPWESTCPKQEDVALYFGSVQLSLLDFIERNQKPYNLSDHTSIGTAKIVHVLS